MHLATKIVIYPSFKQLGPGRGCFSLLDDDRGTAWITVSIAKMLCHQCGIFQLNLKHLILDYDMPY